MKKKVFILLVSSIVCTSVAGCSNISFGKNDKSDDIVPIESEYADIDIPIEEESVVEVETVENRTVEIEMDPQHKVQFDIPTVEPVVVEETETILSLYINELLLTMPLTYSDLEAQGFSIDYSYPVSVTNGISRIYDLKEEDWIVVRDVAGSEVCRVRDDRGLTNSKIITSDNKIAAVAVSNAFANVTYFDLIRGQSTYSQVDEIMHGLGFDSVMYISEGMDEYIVGNINLGGNQCQVWAAISVFEEAGVLKDIFLVNKSVVGNDIGEEYSFRSTPYGVEVGGLSSDVIDVVTEDVMNYTFGDNAYSYSTTIKDYGTLGWKVTGMEMSESGGTAVLSMKNSNVSMTFEIPSLYVTTSGKKHVFSEEALPNVVVYNKDALSKLEFHGLTGVISESKLRDSEIAKFITDESIDGIEFTFDGYGTVVFKMLDGYVDMITFTYVR